MTFLNSSLSHRFGQYREIEIRDISFIPLEVWIISEVFIEFVSSGFSLEENVLAVFWEFGLDRFGYSEGKDAFSCSELDVDEFWRN